MQFKANLYSLTAVTNMHVGSGKNNYGIIDNLVQRDVLSDFPTINSSSLKGAIREYFDPKGAHPPHVTHIFGSDPKQDSHQNKPGKYRFFSANLLSTPVRSNLLPYVNVTCEAIITEFLDNLAKFDIEYPHADTLKAWIKTHSGEATHYESDLDGNLNVEMLDLKATKGSFAEMNVISNLFGKHPVLVSNPRFKELTNDNHLPVISRNYLENGISKNLWYEQVLPRQSRFYFIVLVPDADSHFAQFSTDLQAQPVQVGGNASIGYGFSKISNLT